MRSGAWLFAVLTITACNAVLGIEEPTRVNSLGGSGTGNNNTAGNGSGSNGNSDERQACVLNSNCLETELCVFRVCSPPCQEDRDCFSDERCLQLDGATACVASDNATCTTESQCPEGSTCSEGQCRNPCVAVDAGEQIVLAADAASSLSCLGDQQCVQGVCRGTDTSHDPLGDGGAMGGNGGSGGSGTDGGSLGPGSDAGQEDCTPEDVRCNDNVLETCSAAHLWGNPQTCVYGCRANACSECIPTEKGCFDGRARTCDANGRWDSGTLCPVLCVQGECAISCTSGLKQCDDDIPQTCVDGAWDNGTPCNLGCFGDGECAACEPGNTRCVNSDTQEQLCEADGQWGDLSPCTFGCIGTTCAECDVSETRCVNNDTQVQECNDLGDWDNPDNCAFGCNTATEVCNECEVGVSECIDEFSIRNCPSGMWEPMDCTGQACYNDECTGSCVPDTVMCTSGGGALETCQNTGEPSAMQCNATANDDSMICRTDHCEANVSYSVGNAALLDEDTTAVANRLYWFKIGPIARKATVQSIGITSSANNGTYARLALYEDNAGSAGALMTSTGDVSLNGTANGSGTNPANRVVEAGSYYWIGVVFDVAPPIKKNTNAALPAARYTTLTYGNPFPESPTGSALTQTEWNLFLTVLDVAE
jgi:hypothetical protein